MKQAIKIPVCPESEVIPLIEMQSMPVHCNVLWPTREAALNAPRGSIRLGYFTACGHVYNLDFDPSLMEYTQEYENSLHFSPRFQEYAESLADGLVEKYDLYDKDIVEIGAGKGDFLIMMCGMHGNRGWGYDPTYVPDEEYTAPNVTFIQDFYTEKYTDQKADLIICRHVLEHIEDPDAFVAQVRRAVGDGQETVVFFEVPNSLWTLRQLGIWDIIYEHCSYFSPLSLAHVFRNNGFRVLDVKQVFGGQFLTIEAIPDEKPDFPEITTELTALRADAEAFATNYRNKHQAWTETLSRLTAEGKRGVVWGAGSKGVTFLNAMPNSDSIDYIVDINPRKQGKFVAGTGQLIVPPEYLKESKPDFIIIMNANYREEISGMLREIGIEADILVA
jgi:2-polyprenyl-3-methyl-5-hydroxy-6-metoxy-1,4-benzoquinol methylase